MTWFRPLGATGWLTGYTSYPFQLSAALSMTDILGVGSSSCESTYFVALLSSLRDIFSGTHLLTLTGRVYPMEEMAVVDSETFQREHEPLSTNLVLLVVILVLFHVGAIVSNLQLHVDRVLCICIILCVLAM